MKEHGPREPCQQMGLPIPNLFGPAEAEEAAIHHHEHLGRDRGDEPNGQSLFAVMARSHAGGHNTRSTTLRQVRTPDLREKCGSLVQRAGSSKVGDIGLHFNDIVQHPITGHQPQPQRKGSLGGRGRDGMTGLFASGTDRLGHRDLKRFVWPDPTQSRGQFSQDSSLREAEKQMQAHDQIAHLHHVRLTFSLLPGVGLVQDLAHQGNRCSKT